MCNYPQAYKEVTRKARKEHRCFECHSKIHVSEEYQYVSGVWDGKPGSIKTCLSCAELREFYQKETGEHCLDFGMLHDYIFELLSEVEGFKEYPEHQKAFDKLLGEIKDTNQ